MNDTSDDTTSTNTDTRHAGKRRTFRWLLPALLIVGWLAIGSIGGPFAGKLADVAENDQSSFLPESAEATEVAALQQQFAGSDSVPAVIVAERESGITAADQNYLRQATAEARDIDGVGDGISPVIPSRDGQALQVVAPVAGDPGVVVQELRDLLAQEQPDGLTVLVTGPGGQVADLVEAFGGIDGLLLLVAGIAVAVILVIVYRSPLLPVLVLLSAIFALGLASLTVYLLADNDVLALNGQSQGILFILVFGAATDYALLLVSRFREELRDADRHQAIRTAWRGTIEPIVASAGTVILGVLCLLLSDLQSNQGLGPVAAIGIAAALLASTTFLPAVLVTFGRVAFWPFRPVLGSPHPETRGIWARIARVVDRRPRAIWITTVAVLLVGAAFLPQLKADGTSQSDVFLTEVDSVAGQEVLAQHFPGGSGSPTLVITKANAADTVLAETRDISGVSQAQLTTGPDGQPREVNGLVQIEATLDAASDSEAAIDTVRDIREAVHPIAGADAKVGGQTAVLLDTQETSERDRALIIPVVLLVVFLVLALLLRAVLASLLLIATVVLSFAATMGVAALVFNHVLDFPGADPAVPLFAFVFLVALGIDYNIFLMTRVRDETANIGTRAGTLRGLTLTGGVITSAGVVLAATFAALAVLPLLFLAQMAFIVAFGVLLDTLIVRSLLVPALTVDIGSRVWWPSALTRRQ